MSGAETQLQPAVQVGGDLTDLVADLAAEIAGDGNLPQSIAERAAEWEIELTGEGLPEELAYNAYLPTFIQAEDSVATLKAQLEAARAELTEAQTALDAAGERLALDAGGGSAEAAFHEATAKVAQAEARIRAYESVVIPRARERLEESEATRCHLRELAGLAAARLILEVRLVPALAAWQSAQSAAAIALAQIREAHHEVRRLSRLDSAFLLQVLHRYELVPGFVLAGVVHESVRRLITSHGVPRPAADLAAVARDTFSALLQSLPSPEARAKAKELEAEDRAAVQ